MRTHKTRKTLFRRRLEIVASVSAIAAIPVAMVVLLREVIREPFKPLYLSRWAINVPAIIYYLTMLLPLALILAVAVRRLTTKDDTDGE